MCFLLLSVWVSKVRCAQPEEGDTDRSQRASRPNILWIIAEDMSPHFGCYGETSIPTPNVDILAAEGVLFRNAFVTAPVCSTCRSALVCGMYQTSIGAQHHRSGRGTVKIKLPKHVGLVPQYFKDAGYWTSNGSEAILAEKPSSVRNRKRIGKTDYNFEFDPAVYDSNDWRGRRPGQPFFAQVQLRGGKGRTWQTPRPMPVEDVRLPAYYPDDPVIRDDWAQYLNAVMNTDIAVGRLIERLRRDQELDRTYIFFITDHGISHARGKQFCYEEGTKIPFIVRGPGLKAGQQRDDLVVHIDMAATSMALAGIEIPKSLESVDLFAEGFQPREFVVSARDRCDETVDRIRSVRTGRYRYILNGYPTRPYLQPNAYKDNKPIIKAMRRLHAAGKLTAAQALIMREVRPHEELFDLQQDPMELNNLAASEEHRSVLASHRAMLHRWSIRTGDQGLENEKNSIYDSDMKVYLETIARRLPERAAEISANIGLMKKWAAEGR